MLDVAGMIPVYGMIADGVNALYYLFEGDWGNAALSALAFIPAIGEFAGAGKITTKGVKIAGNAYDAIKYSDEAVALVTHGDDIYNSAKAATEVAETTKKLHRPYIRKATRQAVEAATPKLPDGRFIDINTNLPIDGKYDLGHDYGKEFWRERDKAMAKGWTQKQFNDYMNNPSFYRIEDPISNRSHKFEMR